MITTILLFVGGWAKKVISNPIVIVGVLMVAAVIFGRFWGKAVCEREQQETVIKETKVYLKEYIKIKEKYNGNVFDAQQILSGCIAETTKGQAHCRGK